MSLQSDRWIRKMALEHGMIEPFAEGSQGAGIISYGLSSYGYDVRVGTEFKVYAAAPTGVSTGAVRTAAVSWWPDRGGLTRNSPNTRHRRNESSNHTPTNDVRRWPENCSASVP